MSNLVIWDQVAEVPQNAQKPIKGGRLSGMTDINPVWRLKKLTEIYGQCGIGWYYEVTNKSERACDNGEILVFVDINLYIKQGNDWSKPIHGTGGNKMATKETKGMHYSDEAYKMAETDAISVACKSLGFGSNIYWSNGKSKYNQTGPNYTEQAPQQPQQSNFNQQQPQQDYDPTKCSGCGVDIQPNVSSYSMQRYKKPLCFNCQKQQ